MAKQERAVSERERVMSKLESIVPEQAPVALESKPAVAAQTQTAAQTDSITDKPTPQVAQTTIKKDSVVEEPAVVNKEPAGDKIDQLFAQANAWLGNAKESEYVLQVATISQRSRINRVLATLKQKYSNQSVHVFDQLTPEYYYFYIGLFESLAAANEAITDLNAVGSVVRNIGDSRKRRCATRVENGAHKRQNLGYCN